MTATKYFITIATFWMLSVASVDAQESRTQRFERIEAEKIAYITKELNLTPAEAQEFFPIYNQYFKQISTLKHERRKGQSERQNLQSQKLQGNNLNPNRDVLAFDAKELEVKKIYRKRFSAVVGQARASRFFEVEEEFRNYLMRTLQHRRRDQKP